jgi:hypothetical protein
MWLGCEGVVESVDGYLLRAMIMRLPCGFSEAFLDDLPAYRFQQRRLEPNEWFHSSHELLS